MERRFRALRIVALFYQILAWIALVGGILAGLLAFVLGALSGREGGPSPLVADVPLMNQAVGLLGGIMVGLIVILGSLLCFVLFYAAGEVIYLGLAVEQNTRETAQYLRGEGTLPPPPEQAGEWS